MIAVNRATAEHVPHLIPLFDAYRQFYKRDTDMPTARQFLLDRLSRDESVIFVALENRTALGFTQLFPIFSSLWMQRKWLLNDLFVDPAARGKGVGGMLLKRAHVFAAETGAISLMLQTDVDNFTAQRVYEQHGWQRVTDSYVYELFIGK